MKHPSIDHTIGASAAVTGRVFVAQTPEQFTYDADGNMLTDGRFRYTWNAENRLVRAQELCAPTNRNPYTLTYAYDHRGRMVSKRITENDGNDTLVKSVSYLWDGWNIIREIVRDGGESATVTDNIWGLDLDGTLQGAGGVGGLLAVQRSDCAATNSAFCILHSALYLPTYDANGNVSEYVSTDGSIVAHYDYSPFGETLIESGDLAATFTHRFSTKPWCPVTGLYEYQMRKYRPEIGRWLSRDPIRENGFIISNPNASLKTRKENPLTEFTHTLLSMIVIPENTISEEGNYSLPYIFNLNNALQHIDCLGLDITLETGHNSGSWCKNQLHMQICVEEWDVTRNCSEENKYQCCYKGKTCFSFGANYGLYFLPKFSNVWLGWSSIVIGGTLKGEIYVAPVVSGAKISSRHKTTMKQDTKWFIYAASRLSTEDVYSVARHNCRLYSQLEFADAPSHW